VARDPVDVCFDVCFIKRLDIVVSSEDILLAWHGDGVGHSGNSRLVVAEDPDIRCGLVHEFGCEMGCLCNSVEFCVKYFTLVPKVV
jgi:hypothetical protein